MEALKPQLKADGKFYYGEDPQPGCFATFWNAADPGEEGEDCRNCGFEEVCFPAFVETTFTQTIKRLGKGVTKETLAAKLDVHEQVIVVAAAEAKKLETKSESDMPKKEARKKAPAKKKAKDKTKKKASVKTAAPTKTKPKKRPPPKAGSSVVRVKAPARKATSNVSSAKARDGRVAVKFGEHTYKARWMRERGRNRKIARLKINSTLKVQRNGSSHQCKVKKYHYLYEGQKFPTLYKVTEHITGKGSTWSGPKFWKLT